MVCIIEKARELQKNTYYCLLTRPKPLTVCITTNWKILKEMRIPDDLTCLLRNLYAGQEAIELDMEQQTGSKLGKEYIKAVYCHHASLTYTQSISWEMLGWLKHKLESRLQGEISITSDMQMIPPLWQKVKKNQSLCERGEWKSWLKAQHFRNLRSWHLVPSLHGK